MDPLQLRLRCEQAVDALELPPDLNDPVELCRVLGERRGRPIEPLARETPPSGPCGLVIPGDDRDFVVYERYTSLPHRFHIVAHEGGHLVFGHDPLEAALAALEEITASLRESSPPSDDPPVGPEEYAGLASLEELIEVLREGNLPPAVLARSLYAVEAEAEAEEFANILGERAGFIQSGPVRRGGAVGRVENALRPWRSRVTG